MSVCELVLMLWAWWSSCIECGADIYVCLPCKWFLLCRFDGVGGVDFLVGVLYEVLVFGLMEWRVSV